MDPIVSDANRRFDFAKSLLHHAKSSADLDIKRSCSEMAVTAAFSCLEGMLTHIFEHFIESKNFDIFEKSIMQEKSVKLVRGKPSLGEQRFQSIDDRLQFLFWKFSGDEFDKSKFWWPDFANAVTVRNGIMHPKGKSEITVEDAERAILAIIAALDQLMLTVFGEKWPKANKGIVPSYSL